MYTWRQTRNSYDTCISEDNNKVDFTEMKHMGGKM